MTYDKKYFLNKFSAIPDENWCEGRLSDHAGRHCAMGHCGGNLEEEQALCSLLSYRAGAINDGVRLNYQQPTPKARILAALNDLP